MKKLIIYLLVTIPLICFGNLCYSQIFTENFNYTADPVNGLMTQSGGLWTKLNSGDSILVTSGNLRYSGLTTSTGNNVSYGGAGTDYYRAFTNQTSGTVYASFILRITDISLQTTTGGYTFGFMENGSTTVFGATLWIRNNTVSGTTQFNLGINPRTTAGNTVWSPSVLDEGTPYLIVIAYQIVPGATNDSAKLWINPTSYNGAEPYPAIMAANTLTDLTTGVQKLFLRQDASGTTPSLTIDEMRVGTSWADVTPSVITGETITLPGGSFNNITIDNSSLTLGGNDTISGTMTLQNGGLLTTTTNYTLFFKPTATNPIEDATNRIIGTAIMQYRPVGTSALNFLSVGMLAGTDDLGYVTIQRISGPDGTLGPGINCNWQIFKTNIPSGRDFTLSFPSIYDNGRDMTHAAVFEFGGPISTWYQTGPTVDISALNPRVVTVTSGLGSGFWWSVSDENHKVPVEMASFTSFVNGSDVNLQWSTVYELNNSGFDVERKVINGDWNKIANVKGNGTSYFSHDYSYNDVSLASGRYKYRLKQIDYNGNYKYYDLMNEVVIGVPKKFALMQNYPNPFNPVTQISYELPITSYVSLKIFDMLGKEVASLVNGVKDAGYYSVTFDAKNLSSGTYFYKLTTDKFSAMKKMVVVK